MANQTIDKTEPTQHEVETAWLAHNGARVEAGPDGITAIEAMRVALRAANAARIDTHEKHDEYVDECEMCELRDLRSAYAAIKTEYAGYRHDRQTSFSKLVAVAAGAGSVAKSTLRKILNEVSSDAQSE